MSEQNRLLSSFESSNVTFVLFIYGLESGLLSFSENGDALGAKLTELVEDLPHANKSLLNYLLRHFYK